MKSNDPGVAENEAILARFIAHNRSRWKPRGFQSHRFVGSVRNETEYYMIKAVLDDSYDLLTSEEKKQLGSMLLAFEQAAVANASKSSSLHGSI